MANTMVGNGVDVDRLVQTIDAIKKDADVAQSTFKANARWSEGGTSTAEISSFTHAGQDQPHATLID